MKYTASRRDRRRSPAAPRAASPGRRSRSAAGFTTAPESRCAPATRPLSMHRDRRLAERLRRRRILGQELSEPDRAGDAGRAAADEQHADVDPLVLARLGRRNEFAHPDRGWIVGGAARHGGQDTLPRDATCRPPLRHRHPPHAGDARGDGRGRGRRRRLRRRPDRQRARGRDGAALLGKEAARLRPVGDDGKPGRRPRAYAAAATRSSSIAMAHVVVHEQGGVGGLSGVQPALARTATRGMLDVETLAAALARRATSHHARQSLVCVENTLARGGRGSSSRPSASATSPGSPRAARHATAHGRRPPLERGRGAGRAAGALAATSTRSSVCFSKGLGAPVGSARGGRRAT